MANRSCGNCAHSERSYALCKKENCFNGTGPGWVHKFDLDKVRNHNQIIAKKERALSECDFCAHKNKLWDWYPCCVCKGINSNKFEEKQMEMSQIEAKEPDYSFNPSIIAAMKEGKSVWCSKTDCLKWFEFDKGDADEYWISAVWRFKWALEKPKTKVKKWQWIYKSDGCYDLTTLNFATKIEARKAIFSDIESIEPWLPSEIEIEE
jgi:hypothetical protein